MHGLTMIEHVTAWADSPTIGITLVALFALMIVAKTFLGASQYGSPFRFFRNKKHANYTETENTQAATLLLSFCAVASYGLFIAIAYCRCVGLPYVTSRSVWLPALMCGMVLVWLGVQYVLLKIAGYCANKDADIRQFIRTFFTVFVAGGLLLFPLVVGLVYAPQWLSDTLMYIGFGVLGIGFILLIAKCLQLFFNGFDTVCYLFLYLCTLEILPILLLRNAVRMLVANVLT